EPDRLREDRLAGPGLARDRVQARPELEFGLADQDQVLDAQPAQHPPDGTHRIGARLLADQDVKVSLYRVKNVRSGSVASSDFRSPSLTSSRSPGRNAPTCCPSTITVASPSSVRFQTLSSRLRGITSGRAC